MSRRWITQLGALWPAFLVVLAGASLLTACSPEPRYVSCDIDADCRALGGKYRYCSMKHCVECVGSSVCGYGASCRDGACVPK